MTVFRFVHPCRRAVPAEGAADRCRWRDVLTNAYPRGRTALPPLSQPDGAETWCRVLPGRPLARGGDRGCGDDQLRAVFRHPEKVAGIWSTGEARAALVRLDSLAAVGVLYQGATIWDRSLRMISGLPL